MSTRTRTARVREVEPLDGFLLRLLFDDGTSREVDLEPELWGPMFEPLEDPALFRQVRVDEGWGRSSGRTAPTSTRMRCTTRTRGLCLKSVPPPSQVRRLLQASGAADP